MITANRARNLSIGGLAQEKVVGREPTLETMAVAAAEVEYDHGESLWSPSVDSTTTTRCEAERSSVIARSSLLERNTPEAGPQRATLQIIAKAADLSSR